MSATALRLFIFTLLPVLLAWLVILMDRSAASRERRLETVLVLLFAIGVCASGIFNFISHFFISDIVAESIGWEAGSPFQREVAFANLSLGVLGVIATGRRDGFREATVIAATIFSLGATIVHIMDIVATGNLAPGNTIQNVANLLRPALLIGFLAASRRAEALPQSERGTAAFLAWRMPLLQSSAPLATLISVAYGIGFAVRKPVLISFAGVLIGVAVLVFALARSPAHELRWGAK